MTNDNKKILDEMGAYISETILPDCLDLVADKPFMAAQCKKVIDAAATVLYILGGAGVCVTYPTILDGSALFKDLEDSYSQLLSMYSNVKQ